MKSVSIRSTCGPLVLLVGLATGGLAQAPADTRVHPATQRFHIVAGDTASSFLVYRQHGSSPRERDASMTVVHDAVAGNLDVFTKSFTTAPRWRIDASDKDEVLVYRLDRGQVRSDASYVVKRTGEELSVHRIASARVARYRSAVVDVETSNRRTQVYGTGVGDARLNRAGRRIEHEDLPGLASFTYKALPLDELTGILGALDMLRGK